VTPLQVEQVVPQCAAVDATSTHDGYAPLHVEVFAAHESAQETPSAAHPNMQDIVAPFEHAPAPLQ